MKITDVRVEHYRWPKAKPIANGKHTYTHNELNLLIVDTDEGITGYGCSWAIEFAETMGKAIIGMDPLSIYAAPSAAHPFGCDNMGRDILARICYGARYSLAQIAGGDAAHNARILLSVLRGEDRGAYRAAACENAAAAILAAGRAATYAEALAAAAESIDSGRALRKLEKAIECSKS